MNTSAATGAATKLTGLLILPSGEIYFFATQKKKKRTAATKTGSKVASGSRVWLRFAWRGACLLQRCDPATILSALLRESAGVEGDIWL